MTGRRLLYNFLFILALPLVVAGFGLPVAAAVALLAVALLWRWLATMSGFLAPAPVPDLELESITASHFVEKVRWCLDRLGVDYAETQAGGTLGAFFLGRTVPRLWLRTGAVRSSIGNSSHILRYLWGAFDASHGDRAAFLRPTPERLAMEERLDRYGRDLQVWVYWHILPHRSITLHAWGCDNPRIPAWQRYLLVALFPLQRALMRRAFRLSPTAYEKACRRIEVLLAGVEERLADGRRALLGADRSDFVDISFAALSGLWVQPQQYGAGRADAARLEPERVPETLRADVERWRAAYPLCVAHIERLYREERRPTT